MKITQNSSASSGYLDRIVRRISFLWKSVWALGPVRGLAYWRIMLACEKEPDRVIRWAEQCERESEACKLRGDIIGWLALGSWSNQLRIQHARYISVNARISDREGGAA